MRRERGLQPRDGGAQAFGAGGGAAVLVELEADKLERRYGLLRSLLLGHGLDALLESGGEVGLRETVEEGGKRQATGDKLQAARQLCLQATRQLCSVGGGLVAALVEEGEEERRAVAAAHLLHVPAACSLELVTLVTLVACSQRRISPPRACAARGGRAAACGRGVAWG